MAAGSALRPLAQQKITPRVHLSLLLPRCGARQVFEGIVKDLLVNNGHRATVESVPNTELEAAIEGTEKGKLDAVKKSMSDQVGVDSDLAWLGLAWLGLSSSRHTSFLVFGFFFLLGNSG